MNTKNIIKIFLVALFGLSLISCSSTDPDYCGDFHPNLVMQRVRLIDENGKWMEGIKDAKMELFATDDNWSPLKGKDGKYIRQVRGWVEIDKYAITENPHDGSATGWIHMSMMYTKDDVFRDNGKKRGGAFSSKFLLLVDGRPFEIQTGYTLDHCRRNMPTSFFFDGKPYPVLNGWSAMAVNITIEPEDPNNKTRITIPDGE